MDTSELGLLKSKIDILRIVYAILFGLSLVIIVLQNTLVGFGLAATVAWAGSLGGAVATRLWRTSLVNRYNAAITAGPALLQ